MKVRDVMTASPQMCSPDSSLMDVACAMRDHDTGFIPVCDGDRITGVITDRDIVVRAICQGLDSRQAKARDFLTTDICWVRQDQDVRDAISLMEERQIRRMLVMDENKRLCGVVSLGDLAEVQDTQSMAEEVLQEVSKSEKTLSHSK
jgi:CBS domain-containing protein